MGEMLWAAMNFATSVVLVSGAVVGVQGPIKSLMLSQMRYGQWLPPTSQGNIGLLSTARTLYRGTGAGMAGSSARTAYVTTSKNTMAGEELAAEEVIERHEMEHPRLSTLSAVGNVMAFSLGDVALTQIPESLSQLKKLDITDATFNWKTKHNAKRLFTTGFGSRLGSGAVNFSAICMFEPMYAEALPIQNDAARHFMAGALSGMSAGVVSFPFAYYKDYALGQASVDKNGNLHALSMREIYGQASKYVSEKGVSEVAKQSWGVFRKQAPMRLALSTAIFSVIAGVGEVIGEAPLSKTVEKVEPVCKKAVHSFGFFPAKAKEQAPDAAKDQVQSTKDQDPADGDFISEPWCP